MRIPNTTYERTSNSIECVTLNIRLKISGFTNTKVGIETFIVVQLGILLTYLKYSCLIMC